jgi:hypothetical protein
MSNWNPDSEGTWPTPPPAPGPHAQPGWTGPGGAWPGAAGGAWGASDDSSAAAPGAADGSGSGNPDPSPSGDGPRRTGRATRWGIAIAAAAVLIGGGTAILVGAGQGGTAGLASSTSPAGQTSTAAAGSKAALSTLLSSDGSDLAVTSAPGQAAAAARSCAAVRRLRRARPAAAKRFAAAHPAAAVRLRVACGRRLRRLRRLPGMYGQFTYKTAKGSRTLAFERGTIRSVSGSTVTVAAANGTTWSWHVVSATIVRRRGAHQRLTAASLAAGQHVFVAGPVTGGADDIRLVVIAPAGAAASPAS